MITGELKRKVDALWTEFWTGGISNPMTVVEQISYLMFIRILDIREDMSERILNQGGKAVICYPENFEINNRGYHYKATSNEDKAE